MQVLITGGAGYVGSVLTECLLYYGHNITVVDNFMWGQTSLNHLCRRRNLKIIKGDCRDMRLMDPLLKDCDVFIPLAALVGAPLCDQDPNSAWSTNCGAVKDSLQCLSLHQRIIIPNTNSGYGSNGGVCTEETPLTPISLYGKSKATAEDLVIKRGNSVSLRLATVFGMSPRMRLDLLVNDFVFRAAIDSFVVLYEPHFKRNYIHIQDVAIAFEWALKDLASGVYNVGLSDANLSKLELCQEIAKQFPGFEFTIGNNLGKDPDKRDYIVSNEKIEEAGFKPSMSLADGIAELKMGYAQFSKYRYGNV